MIMFITADMFYIPRYGIVLFLFFNMKYSDISILHFLLYNSVGCIIGLYL